MKTITEMPHFLGETHWEKAAKTRMGKYLTRIETNFIKDSVDLSRAQVVMDVGAEAGRFSQLSTNPSSTVISIDINTSGLKRLKQKIGGVNVVQADARCVPFKDELFDAIFMIEVLDYVTQLNSALSECHRTLKQGKSVILSFGNKSSIKAKLREIGGKYYRHSYTQVMHSLRASGLTTERKIGYNWLPFGRMSENKFIPILAWVEGVLGFRRIPRLSPWVIVEAARCVAPFVQKAERWLLESHK